MLPRVSCRTRRALLPGSTCALLAIAVTSATAPAAELKTPRATLARFTQALEAGSAADFLDCLDLSGPGDQAVRHGYELMFAVLTGSRELAVAMKAKYGNAADAAFNDSVKQIDAAFANMAKNVEAAQVSQQGDRATIVFPGRPQGTMTMVRKEGVWRIQPDGASRSVTEQSLKQLQMLSTVIKLARRVVDESATYEEYRKAEAGIMALLALALLDKGPVPGGKAPSPKVGFADLDPATRFAKQIEALELFREKGHGATTMGTPNLEMAFKLAKAGFRCGKAIDDALNAQPSLSAAVRQLAKDLSRRMGNVEFTIVDCRGPTIQEVRAVLGTEESSVTKDVYRPKGQGPFGDIADSKLYADDMPVKWYCYGWLKFGEVNGTLCAVRASATDVVTAERKAGEYDAAKAVRESGSPRPHGTSPATGASDEAKAASYLTMAKTLAKNGRAVDARKWAQKAVDAAPKSAAADEARALIAELRQ